MTKSTKKVEELHTHPKDCRIVMYGARAYRELFPVQSYVLHFRSTEYDVLVRMLCRGNILLRRPRRRKWR